MTYRQGMSGRSRGRVPQLRGSALVLVALLAAPAARAQDSQYWNIQYGPAAQLLGGLVVGSSRDLSATYYNPGGLALGTSADFLLSAQAFKAESLSTKPVNGGAILDNSQTQFDVFPGFFAFSFPKSWFGDNTRAAFSLLTRQQFNMRIDQRFAGDTSSGNGRYGIETLFDQRMSETWGGLTVSHQISNHFGLGATVYGIYRGQRTRLEQSLQLSYPDGRGISALAVDDFNYSHWRTLAKIGLAWEGDRLRLGGAVTTPRVAVGGSGKLGFTRSATGADLNGDGKLDNLLVNAYDEDLDAGYDSSWAFSAGASWRRGSFQFHTSAEYFAPVESFVILEGRTADSAGRPLTLVQQQDGVFNLGGGAEYWLGGVTADKGPSTGGTVLYAAFITDFTSSPEVVRNEAASANMNLYHLSAGSAFSLGTSRFSLGLTWAYGQNNRNFGLDRLPPSVPVMGEPRPVTTRYSRLVFVLGYLFGSDK